MAVSLLTTSQTDVAAVCHILMRKHHRCSAKFSPRPLFLCDLCSESLGEHYFVMGIIFLLRCGSVFRARFRLCRYLVSMSFLSVYFLPVHVLTGHLPYAYYVFYTRSRENVITCVLREVLAH